VTGNTLSAAKQRFAQACPGRIRKDCDPFGTGWQCSTETLPLRPTSNSPAPSPAPTPSVPTGNNAVLSIQAENASRTTGSGWSTERSLSGFTGSGYIVWRGADDFRTSDSNPPAGIKAYDFTVRQAGTYQFTARVQARVGNGSAAFDKDNDAWVKFTSGSPTAGVRGNAAKWTKFFVGGSDESWKNYSNGEQYDPTFFTSIQRDLPVGTHRVLIGGRSARFAIDRVGLQLVRASGPDTPTNSAPPVATPAPAPSPTQPTAAPPSNGNCTAVGASLAQAKANYANSCPTLPRRDCDPIGGGRWICSSGNITNGTIPVASNPTPPASPAPSPDPAPAPAPAPTTPTPTVPGVCIAQGPSKERAISNYRNNCPRLYNRDCDPIGGGVWLCASQTITPSIIDRATAPSGSNIPTSTGGNIGRFSSNDLLALHFDNCPDRDDGHAAVAGKAVIDSVGLENVIVVNGTCGASIRDRYQPASERVMRAVWGNDWLDSFNNEASAVATSADRWAATLANGDNVWVAEGGPSDFTAKVLRRIGDRFPSVDRKRVHVIQHSAGERFNERLTSDAAISLVKRVADYRAIPDGNSGNNGSADFNQRSSTFVNIARQSRYASEWNAAFDYLDPNVKIDFSDTVEVLYIINDTQTQTVNAFASRYLR